MRRLGCSFTLTRESRGDRDGKVQRFRLRFEACAARSAENAGAERRAGQTRGAEIRALYAAARVDAEVHGDARLPLDVFRVRLKALFDATLLFLKSA